MSEAYNPAKDGAQMSFDGRMSYSEYLQRLTQITTTVQDSLSY